MNVEGSSNGNTPEELYSVGFTRYQTGDYARARTAFESIMRYFPDSPEAIRSKHLIIEIDQKEEKEEDEDKSVFITGIDIPFWSLTGFLVKLAFATIPAAIIIGLVYAFIIAVLAAAGLGRLAM